MPRHFRIAGIVAMLMFEASSLAAQTPDAASIRGTVVDASHVAISGAEITLTSTLSGAQHRALSDATGRFSFAGLPAGNYSVLAHKDKFADLRSYLTLAGGAGATLQLQLNVSAVNTQIVVTGAVGEVRTDEPALGDHLGSVQVEETPLPNRRITYLPLLNAANRPAINQGDVFMNQNMFTTNGSGRRQTTFVVDGATGNDSWGRQTIFTNIPEAAVQEITVLENAFSADYGATSGGVVNIVTKSGGKDYHGSLLGLWRPNGASAKLSGFTAATATSGNQIVSNSLGQLGASFSGLIPKTEHTRFFFAGEYSRQNLGSPVTSPIAPGVFVGHYADWMTFLRLDHRINQNNNLFFRADTDSYHDTNPNGAVGGNNLATTDRVFRRRTYSNELSETMVISPSLVNTARVQFQLASPITQFDPVILGTQFSVPISTGGTFTTGTSQSALLMNRQYEFDDTLSATLGRHTLRVGADVLRSHTGGDSKEFGGPIYLGQFNYSTCTQPLAICEGAAYLNDINNVQSYTQSYGNADYTVDDTLWSLFAQDDWKLRPDLTFNLGLRYDRQTFTDATQNIGPRAGFVYDWRGDGTTVLRGGFGIYYSQVVDNSEANYVLTGPTGVFNYTATPGQIGFPGAVADAPLPAFPTGAAVPLRSLYIRPGMASYYNQFFPTSVLQNYPDALLNPYSEQWTLGIERKLATDWVLSVDYVGSHTVHVVRPLDVDPPAPFIRTAANQYRGAAPNGSGTEQCIPNPAIGNTATTQLSTCAANAANATRPLWVYDAANGVTPAYSVIQSDVNDGVGSNESLNVNLSHHFSKRLVMLASYVYSHSIDNVDPDVPGQNPNDPNFTGAREIGNAIFDQRHRFVLSGMYTGPLDIRMGGIATLGSGLPYNIVTGTTNSGDTRATTDRPVINGTVVGRNTGRGSAVYDFSPFVEREFPVGERVRLKARAEAFNIFNHANFVGYSGTYGNGAAPGPGFGGALTGITNQLPARSFQFSAAVLF
ncbi:MAG TPA: TonB-dependent receptor [Candidatus Acidoferrales bacterium]|nr:TonB-dependent receptor [Candidatus Acidoferrales bacterium]